MQEREQFLKPEIKKEDRELKEAKRGIGTFFDSHEDGQKRIESVFSKIEPFLKSKLIDGEKVSQSLMECSEIKNREEFIERVFSALKPLNDLKKNNPEAFGAVRRSVFIKDFEAKGFLKINEILFYGEAKDYIHIHLAPAEQQIGIGKLRKLVREGFEELAKIIKANLKIKRIEAQSWIVAKNPGVMENLGFTVSGEIDEKTQQEHFADDEMKIGRATMTREQFLDRYLREK